MVSTQEQEQEIRKSWFADHTGVYSEQCNIERLLWAKPETSVYSVEYLRTGNCLCVLGDIGDAVYLWSESVSLDWISRCNCHYFHSKCRASAHGMSSTWYDWDPERAKTIILETAAEDDVSDDLVASAVEESQDKHSWKQFCASSEAEELFGVECFEYLGIGAVIPIRCVGHLVGLKMAAEQGLLSDTTSKM